MKGWERTKKKSQVEMLFESVVWLDFVEQGGGDRRNGTPHGKYCARRQRGRNFD